MEPVTIYADLGRKIRRYREAAHQTQSQLAMRLGISRASLANIEAGRQKVLVHYLYAIADALDLGSPSILLASPADLASDGATPNELPLPEEGLTEKQRREVLRLMGAGLISPTTTDLSEDK